MKDSSEKIVSRDVLAKIVQGLKREGKIIVTTNGSFDLLHIGHVTMLQEAKSLGDALIVGMNSDTSVKRYKGKHRPICPQAHRAEMLAALEYTDYITIFDESTPIEFLKIVQPNIHVNSPEHGYECVEREVVEQHGGRVHLARLIEGMSTSQLIERILEAASHEPRRAIFLNLSDLRCKDQEKTLNTLKQFQMMGFQLFILEHPDKDSMRQVHEICQQEGIEFGNVPGTFESAWPVKDLEKAADDYDLSLAKSLVISSEMKDIQMGRQVNCKTILFGKHTSSGGKSNSPSALGPNYIVENLRDAADLLAKRS